MTPEVLRRALDAQARLQSDGFYRLLSGESVVVVVGNYKCYRWIYEVLCSSACTSGFVTHVECRVVPRGCVLTFKNCVADFSSFRLKNQPFLNIRCFSRFQSASFLLARLSCSFLPLPTPTSSFARPFFQYMAVATNV